MSETNRMIHTPEGVRDIYTGECGSRLAVQERILKVLYSYGYEQIQTPSFEFMETFRQDRGSAGSREMFKFFDRDNNTLVLRPDMTPAIARCVAKYFKDETMPLRLCYLERTYKNNSSYQGRLKERTETGAELIGDNCADADGEMIALVTACLKASGLEEFQVELGQARFYQSLLEEAGLDEETEEELSRLIENKNPFGVEALLKERPMREELRRLFIRLPELFGTADEIRQVRTLTDNPKALEAVDRLLQVHQVIEACGLSRYVTYDLGMLSNYRYYTGIIFKAYTYGTGEYIATGGRYDGLLSKFGKDFPAIGFAIVLDRLMDALSRQNIPVEFKQTNTLLLYEESARKNALWLAGYLRNHGLYLQSMKRREDKTKEDYRQMGERRGFRNLLYLEGDGRIVRNLDLVRGCEDQVPLSAYGYGPEEGGES